MYCFNCGKEINPETRVCPFCNTEITHGEVNAAENDIAAAENEPAAETVAAAAEVPVHSVPPVKAPKSRLFKILAISIPVVVLLLAAAAWAAVSSGMFLSPKQYYVVTESKNFILDPGQTRSPFIDSISRFESLSKGKSKSSDVEISLAIDDKNVPEDGAQLVKFLNALKIHSFTATDPAELKMTQKLGLSIKEKELLDMNFYLDKTKLYADIPVLLDKYFLVDLKNIKAAVDNLGVDSSSLPESITEDDIREAMSLGKDQANKDDNAAIMKKYGQLYYDTLPESCFTLDRSSPLELEGRKINCDKIEIKLSEEQFKDLILTFTDALKNDQELFDLMSKSFQNSNKFMELSEASMAVPGTNPFDKENFKKSIQELEDAVKNDMKAPDGITMTVWANKGIIVKRTIETALSDGTEKIGLKFNASKIKADDGKYRTNVALDMSDDEQKGKVTIVYSGASWTDQDKSELWNGEVKLLADTNGASDANFVFKWDASAKGSEAAKTISAKYDLTLDGSAMMDSNFNVNGEFTDKFLENAKSKLFSDDIELSMNIKTDGDNEAGQYGGKLKLLVNRAYDVDLKLPELQADKTVDLATVDQEQLGALGTEAVMAVIKLINDNPWLNEYADFNSLGYMFGGME